MSAPAYVLPFSELSRRDTARVGGKNASLGELLRALAPEGIRVPDGFATTADAYWAFLDHNGLRPVLRLHLGRFERGDASLQETGAAIRSAMLGGSLPAQLSASIQEAYRVLSERYGVSEADVAVRSSATAEDLPEASFAGQQETYLGVRGEASVARAVQACFASLFTDRAIAYREAKGFDHLAVALSAGVQKMVRADKGGAGVLFTLDPETGFPGVVVLDAAWGLGENVVKGAVNPDEYVVFKALLDAPGPDGAPLRPILSKRLGSKSLTMVYAEDAGAFERGPALTPVPSSEARRIEEDAEGQKEGHVQKAGHPAPLTPQEELAVESWSGDGEAPLSSDIPTGAPEGFRNEGRGPGPEASLADESPNDSLPVDAEKGATVNCRTPESLRQAFVLSDDEALQLARWGVAVEQHYGRPMDVEWAKDGETGDLFILQARPETVEARRSAGALRTYRIAASEPPVVRGEPIGRAVAQGPAVIVRGPGDLGRVQPGDVIVTAMTEPDWVPALRRAAALVTDAGGRTCHAAIVSRELGVPAVVGTGDATRVLRDGEPVTVSCVAGGAVYRGSVPFERDDLDVEALPSTQTRVMLNLAAPEGAFQWWRLPAAGVGLARMEFVVAEHVGVHPMALVHPERVAEAERARITARVSGAASPEAFFVDRLAQGIGTIAASQWPRPVVVRFSDFKTNEYARLLGGAAFEPEEENPMLGWRGASRYYSEGYREGFALECRAVRAVRDRMGLTNVVAMVPFCRTPQEADRVLDEMARHGLRRGENGLQVYVMAEVPSNVIEAEAFATRFDGFSIGSNDLTQLVLGTDRDSERLAYLFDEREASVEWAVRRLVRLAHHRGRPVGLCGQAPSDHPGYAAFLVEAGIDSISVTPDAFAATVAAVAEAEARLGVRPEVASRAGAAHAPTPA